MNQSKYLSAKYNATPEFYFPKEFFGGGLLKNLSKSSLLSKKVGVYSRITPKIDFSLIKELGCIKEDMVSTLLLYYF